MNTDLTQRARTMHAEAPISVRVAAGQMYGAPMFGDRMSSDIAVAHSAPAYRPTRTAMVSTATAPFGFALNTTNPCVISATWLGGTKHEHQRLKERSLT